MKRKSFLTLILAGVLSLSLYVPALADDLPAWSAETGVAEWVDSSGMWTGPIEFIEDGDPVSPEWSEDGQPAEAEWVDPSQVWTEPSEWTDAGDTVPPEWSNVGDDVSPEWPEAEQPAEAEWMDPSEEWVEPSEEWVEPSESMDAGDNVPVEDDAPEAPVQQAAPWYAEAQQHVIEQGIMSGTTEGFDPLGVVTRVVAFHALWNMEGTPARKDFAPFSDVPLECWYQESASWAQEAGITQGDGAGHYNPQWTITRAELATAFYRYAQFRGQDMTVTDTDAYLSYSDALLVPEYASDALRWAVDRGILNGKIQNGVLCLDFGGDATRAELATMLMRLDRLLNPAA